MVTPKEHWQHAAECLELAKEAKEFFVKSALTELAAECNKLADQMERAEQQKAGAAGPGMSVSPRTMLKK